MIQATDLKKYYGKDELLQKVLKGIDLHVKKGEFLAIMGRSGAGKSTLLYQLSLLDEPTEGQLMVDGVDVLNLNEKERTHFRLERLGYVFQDYAILPELTALENVAVPLLMRGMAKADAYKKAENALKKVDLMPQLHHLPSQLSGGEQQRVSIARAIAHSPKILFADEPTANLDGETAKVVMAIFAELHAKGQTIVMVTHEMEYGKQADRILKLKNGLIES